mgnify:CR=1 FL=1
MADLLQSELIKLRAMEPEDIEILYRWENDTDIWKVSNTIAPFSKYVLRQFIEHMAFERAGRAALKGDPAVTPDYRVAHLGNTGRGDRSVRPRPLQPARRGRHPDLRQKRPEARIRLGSRRTADPLLFPDTGTQPALLQYTGRQHRQPGSVQKQRVPGNRTEERVDQNHIGLAG